MKFIIILLVSLFFSGCKKYLDKKAISQWRTPSTLTDLQRLLDDAYIMNLSVNAFGEASADDYFLTDEVFNSMSETDRKCHTWPNFVYSYPNDWSMGYRPVYNANLVLEQLQEIPKKAANDSIWKAIYGSALFFRSHQFLSMLWAYGPAYDAESAHRDLGIAIRTSTDQQVQSTRASVADCYARIIDDLRKAADALPASNITLERPTSAAAEGLLARSYLAMGNYDSAFYFANRVLLLHNDLMDFNNGTEVDIYGFTTFKRFNKETIFYAELNSIQTSINQFFAYADTSLYASYEENDLRTLAYFFQMGENRFMFKGSYGEMNVLFGGVATDEMYLIRAEASAHRGNLASALSDLNTLLRSRWLAGTYNDISSDNQVEVLGLIKIERRKELLMRGLRWADIKRYNRDGDNISVKRLLNGQLMELPPRDPRFNLPLPHDVIQQSQMQQNQY